MRSRRRLDAGRCAPSTRLGPWARGWICGWVWWQKMRGIVLYGVPLNTIASACLHACMLALCLLFLALVLDSFNHLYAPGWRFWQWRRRCDRYY